MKSIISPLSSMVLPPCAEGVTQIMAESATPVSCLSLNNFFVTHS